MLAQPFGYLSEREVVLASRLVVHDPRDVIIPDPGNPPAPVGWRPVTPLPQVDEKRILQVRLRLLVTVRFCFTRLAVGRERTSLRPRYPGSLSLPADILRQTSQSGFLQRLDCFRRVTHPLHAGRPPLPCRRKLQGKRLTACGKRGQFLLLFPHGRQRSPLHVIEFTDNLVLLKRV